MRFVDLVRARGWQAMAFPLFGAPMAGVSGGSLAAATARGGALGSIAMPLLRGRVQGSDALDPDPCGSLAQLAREVSTFESEAPPGAPLCIGFIEDHCVQRRGDFSIITDAIAAHRPAFVQLFAPASNALVREIRARCEVAGLPTPVLMAQAGCVRDARRLIEEARVDVVIAQGTEAGGHGLHPEMGSGTLPLARRVAEIARASPRNAETPARALVLAAGGIVDGAGAATALVLGCDGAVLGTRLWATHQAMGSSEKKADLVAADADDAVRSNLYDVLNNRVQGEMAQGILWRHPFETCGVIEMGTEPEPEPAQGPGPGTAKEAGRALAARKFRLAGKGVGGIAAIADAETITREIS